jgi:hypothetical protein
MHEPWSIDNVPYLRGETPGQAIRLPSPPALMAPTGASVTLYRYAEIPPQGQPVGGAVLSVALDLGAPSEDVEWTEAGLPSEVSEVVDAAMGPSLVRLQFAGREIDRAEVPAGHRPVVSLSAVLGVDDATLLREIVRYGTGSPVFAIAEGGLPVHHDGAADTVKVALKEAPSGELTAAQVADLLDDAIDDGPDRLLGLALAAAQLFEPVASERPWSLVPGWRPPGYCADAPLRARPAGPGPTFEVRIGLDTVLPWFAAAPIKLPDSALRQVELPGSRVQSVQFRRNTDGRPVTVELDGGGHRRKIELTDDEPRTLRFLPPPDWSWDDGYRWRIAGEEWQTSTNQIQIVTQLPS